MGSARTQPSSHRRPIAAGPRHRRSPHAPRPAGRVRSAAVRILVTGGAGFIGSEYVRAAARRRRAGRRRRRGHRARQAHLRRQPRQPRPRRADPRLRVRPQATSATPRARRRHSSPATTPWSTSPPSPTSTAPSPAPPRSSPPTCSAPRSCSTPRCATASAASCTSPPTRSTAPSTTGSWTERAGRCAATRRTPPSKAGSDLLALAYHRTHGLDVVVTRCSNNYGPYQFPEKVIPLFVTNLLDGGTRAALRRRRQRPRLAARRRPLPRHRPGRSRRAAPARSTTSAAAPS